MNLTYANTMIIFTNTPKMWQWLHKKNYKSTPKFYIRNLFVFKKTKTKYDKNNQWTNQLDEKKLIINAKLLIIVRSNYMYSMV